MILSNLQLDACEAKLRKLERSISKLEAEEKRSSDHFRFLELQALKGLAIEIGKDIEEYNYLKKGKFILPNSIDLSNLPTLLIQTRIARGWSQEKLANLSSTTLSAIQRYEENSYLGASISKKLEIANLLKIDTSRCFLTQSANESDSADVYKLRNLDEVDLQEFPATEAVKRGCIPKPAESDSTDAFKNWLSGTTGQSPNSSLHRKGKGMRLPPHIPSIWTWQARILHLANSEIENSHIPRYTGDERWLKELVAKTNEPDGPAKVKELLLEQGIIFVVERHLPKTYLDGAALLSHDGFPIVALTLRYNRLDYFWFTLFHELAHVYLHLFTRHHFNFFDRKILNEKYKNDSSEFSEHDELENEADRFALKKLIAPEEWEHCISRRTATVQDVKSDAKRLNLHPSIIAGRIRKERGDFKILGSLLGQGSLHQHFDGYRT